MRRLIALLVLCLSAARGETQVERLLEAKLLSRIRAYDAAQSGVLGVAIVDLAANRTIVHNADAVFPTASSIKIAILAELFRAVERLEFKLSDEIVLAPAEAVGGSGVLADRLGKGPVHLSVLDLAANMIEHSDNTATNRAIAIVKIDRVNRMLTELGFKTIRLRRIMMDTAAARRGDENVASPAEMARLATLLERGKLADAASTRQMLDLLKRVNAGMRSAVPPNVEVASKPGDLNGVECETGIVYVPGRPFVLSVFGTFLDDGTHPVADIAAMVYEHFAKLAESNAYGNRVGR
jgi:beta-lactamase class A